MHYNSSNAPGNAPSSSTIASLASIAYGLWADTYSFLTVQNGSPFTTTAGRVDDDFSVISWFNAGNTNRLAEAHTYPNDWENGIFYGPNSNKGVDIWFNYDIGSYSWYFGTTAPSSHTDGTIDFAETLAHELGHGIGLMHVYNTNSIMYPGYIAKTGPVRGQSDGDLAGRVYQHTVSPLNISGAIPHSIVLSAISNRTINLSGNLTIPSDKTFQIESSSATLNLNNFSAVVSGTGQILIGPATINGLRAELQDNTVLRGLCGTIQSALNNSFSGCTIHINGGTYNENLTVGGKNNLSIIGQGAANTIINGNFTAYFCNNLNINSLRLNNITAYYCNLGDFYCNINSGGMGLYSCSGFDQFGNITNCSTGFHTGVNNDLVNTRILLKIDSFSFSYSLFTFFIFSFKACHSKSISGNSWLSLTADLSHTDFIFSNSILFSSDLVISLSRSRFSVSPIFPVIALTQSFLNSVLFI